MLRAGKWTIAFALTFILLFLPALTNTGIVASAEGRFFIVNSSRGLNLRFEANSKSWIITTLHEYDKVREIQSSGNWLYVETEDGDYGFCYKKYLTLSGRPISDPDEEPKYSGDLAFVSKEEGLNAYWSASTTSKVKGRISYESIVTLIQYKGNWGYIETMSGNRGFVELMYIDKLS